MEEYRPNDLEKLVEELKDYISQELENIKQELRNYVRGCTREVYRKIKEDLGNKDDLTPEQRAILEDLEKRGIKVFTVYGIEEYGYGRISKAGAYKLVKALEKAGVIEPREERLKKLKEEISKGKVSVKNPDKLIRTIEERLEELKKIKQPRSE